MTARRRTGRPGRPRTFRRATRAVAVTAASATLLSGCGTLGGGTAEADEPITVMTWAPQDTQATNMPGMPAMAQAYARWVNAEGGINGHPLRVVTCNDHNETVHAARCASRAEDEGAVAVVGSYSQHGRSFMSSLESSGIPYIGGYGIADEEFTSPLSYPVHGGIPALVAGNGRQLAAGHCARVSLVRPDTIAGDQMPSLLNSGLADGDVRPAADVRAPEGASDYTEHARTALREAGADSERYGVAAYGGKAEGACVTAMLGGRTGTFFDSFRRLQHDNPQVRTASVLGSVEQSLVDRSGGTDSPLEGAYATGWYPAANDPRWEPMKKVVSEHAFGDNRIDTADSGVQTTWVAYTVLRHVLEAVTADGQGPVTAKTVRSALDNGTPVDTGGLTPELSWAFDDMLAARDFPRIVNTMVTYQRVREGRLVAVRDGFVDVERTLEGGSEA
ncbi:ABC transporter substrate-binding protein [Streptomyces sp. HNM0574]|uniref:ABC transporter substrate-binding protein n=1 Tax=Streptomyces sp. HNM0574 TaxID=2714954 RepID=UPI00146D3D8E|nr:ABC transporter substrate-binding protein [Streptomyces sp. HNM0574]NLU70921.1 ABC transporter substrate-binding protein [Streptomyces sp. HNM0574]